jgi:hypothetical protein
MASGATLLGRLFCDEPLVPNALSLTVWRCTSFNAGVLERYGIETMSKVVAVCLH